MMKPNFRASGSKETPPTAAASSSAAKIQTLHSWDSPPHMALPTGPDTETKRTSVQHQSCCFSLNHLTCRRTDGHRGREEAGLTGEKKKVSPAETQEQKH